MENWLGFSFNQIQVWTRVRKSYSHALEQGPLMQGYLKGRAVCELWEEGGVSFNWVLTWNGVPFWNEIKRALRKWEPRFMIIGGRVGKRVLGRVATSAPNFPKTWNSPARFMWSVKPAYPCLIFSQTTHWPYSLADSMAVTCPAAAARLSLRPRPHLASDLFARRRHRRPFPLKRCSFASVSFLSSEPQRNYGKASTFGKRLGERIE